MRRLLGLLALLCALSMPAVAVTPALAAQGQHHAKHAAHGKPKHGAARHTTTAPKSQPPSTAAANAILKDCQAHGALTKQYPKADLRRALAIMSPSIKQYSNCQTVIQQALLHGINVNGGSGSGGGGTSATTIIIIVVVVILVLAAVIFGGLAIRRRRGGGGPGGAGGPEDPTRVRPPDDEA